MNKKGTFRVAVIAASMLGAVAGTAISASASTPAVSAQDRAFFLTNAQSNLAEISLGKLGGQKGTDAATKALARIGHITGPPRRNRSTTIFAKIGFIYFSNSNFIGT